MAEKAITHIMGSKSFDLCDQRESKHGYTGQYDQKLLRVDALPLPYESLITKLQKNTIYTWLSFSFNINTALLVTFQFSFNKLFFFFFAFSFLVFFFSI